MSHITPNEYTETQTSVVPGQLIQFSLFCISPSAIVNNQLARTNNKYTRINLRLSSIFAYFFFSLWSSPNQWHWWQYVLSVSRMWYLHKWSKKEGLPNNRP